MSYQTTGQSNRGVRLVKSRYGDEIIEECHPLSGEVGRTRYVRISSSELEVGCMRLSAEVVELLIRRWREVNPR